MKRPLSVGVSSRGSEVSVEVQSLFQVLVSVRVDLYPAPLTYGGLYKRLEISGKEEVR